MKFFSYFIFFALTLALFAVEPNQPPIEKKQLTAQEKADAERTEKNIVLLTSRLLEINHYSRQPFDDEISGKFLDRYFDALDGMRLHFLQSDLADFESYRDKLDDLATKSGDSQPAHLIFARMLERVEQRVAYVNELLKTEKFEFTGDDRYTPDRRKLPRPENIEEARKLWRQHLRSEFLQEKISLGDTNKVHAKLEEKEGTNSAGRTFITKIKKEGSVETNSLKSATFDSTNVLTDTEEIIKTLTKRYARLEKTLKEFDRDDVFELYLNALARVYDPHSDYMGRSHFENFSISMHLSLTGIGALLQSEDGYCKIKELMPGPAMLSKKIKPGDRIVAVAQGDGEPVDVVDMKLNKVVALIRGEKGTEVRLTIWPGDAPDSSTRKTVALIRDVIKLEDQEAKAKVFEVPAENDVLRLGVIELPSFYAKTDGPKSEQKSTTEDIARLLKKLNEEKVSGIILDLRLNGGGLLDEAVNLTGLFITNGPVVQVKDQAGEIITLSDTDTSVMYKGPLIILTSRFSASASEILAGALQDYGRALVVGDTSTFGKGTVQKLLKLDPYLHQNGLKFSFDPGALKPTTAKFYRAGGSSTQLRGVIPDIQLPSVLDFMEVGEASMEGPLPWDEVSSSDFEKWNHVKPFLPELQKRSEGRILEDQDFDYIRQDIEQFKKRLADKSLSLNEEERRKEKAEMKARTDARKEERKARNLPEPKIFEVTLKNASEPGLQLYVPKTNDVAEVASALSELDPESEADEKTPSVDATLEETKRILADYISLLKKRNPALSKADSQP